MSWSWENAGGGALAGASIGGTAGTMVMPGVGTAVGAVGGGLIGGALGGMGGLGGIMDNMQGVTDAGGWWAQQNDARRRQEQDTNVVRNWALTGQGPSAAQQMVNANRAQNAAQMVGAAKSMPGGNPALANQMAAEGIARGNSQATLQGAQLRAQEQQEQMKNLLATEQAQRETSLDAYKARQAVDINNQENRKSFIGGLMSGGGGLMGGFM